MVSCSYGFILSKTKNNLKQFGTIWNNLEQSGTIRLLIPDILTPLQLIT